MKHLPLVSVVTPTFNAGRHIERCLRSIERQDYPSIEHVIVDGLSLDETVAIVEKSPSDTIERKLISEADFGLYDAMSKGVRSSSGEIVHILNADDWYASDDVISQIVRRMEEREVDLLHAKVALVSQDGEIVRLKGEDVSFDELRLKMRVAHPSVFVRRALYESFGPFSISHRMAADQEWLLRVWKGARIDFMADVIVNMQMGGVSMSNVEKSIRDSASVAVLHGLNPMSAAVNYYKERLKHWCLLKAKRL